MSLRHRSNRGRPPTIGETTFPRGGPTRKTSPASLHSTVDAWNGAIKFQERNGNSALAGSAMPLNQFLEYFARLHIAAGLPPTL